MYYLIPIVVFIFGAIIGSFLNVCIYRIPLSKSIVKPNSFCPNCEKPVRVYDNIPIVGYIMLGGKCRDCGARISLRYPFIELLTAILFLVTFRRWGISSVFFINIFLASLFIVISFIDLDFQIIPDILSIGGLAVGIIISFMRPGFSFKEALYGVLLGGGVLFVIAYGYQLIAKREGMGGGDIKLLAMIGSFLGFKGVIFSLVGGSLMGTIVGIPLMLIKGKDSKYAIPFGPFLSLSAVIFLFWGNWLVYIFNDVFLKR
jgi:leader peptidase (prepilin peptidase)/N-methyltransferase